MQLRIARSGARISLGFRALEILPRALAAGLLALGLTASGAGAEGEGAAADAEPRWIPSLDLGFDTFGYSAKVSAINQVNPPSWEGTSDAESVQLRFRIGGELTGPKLDWLPGSPRPFARGGVGLPTFSSDELFTTGSTQGDTERDILRFEGRRAADLNIALPPRDRDPRNGIPDCFDENPSTCATADISKFEAQGTRLDAKLGDVSGYAGLGLAFEIPAGESFLFQVKPSLDYQVEQVDFSGRLTTVTEGVGFVEFAGQQFPIQTFQVHRGAASASSTDHSLGAGIELGMALFRRARPIRTWIYADARFLWLLGSSRTTLSDPVASWEVDRDRFGVRGGAGVRFSWVGFASR